MVVLHLPTRRHERAAHRREERATTMPGRNSCGHCQLSCRLFTLGPGLVANLIVPPATLRARRDSGRTCSPAPARLRGGGHGILGNQSARLLPGDCTGHEARICRARAVAVVEGANCLPQPVSSGRGPGAASCAVRFPSRNVVLIALRRIVCCCLWKPTAGQRAASAFLSVGGACPQPHVASRPYQLRCGVDGVTKTLECEG